MAYLQKVHETATEGDVREEFVGVGCCGDTRDLTLRVESVEGGECVDADTEFVFRGRSESDRDGGWRVRSVAGP